MKVYITCRAPSKPWKSYVCKKKDTTANNELRSGSPPPLFNGVESAAAAAVQQFSRNVLASNHRRRVEGASGLCDPGAPWTQAKQLQSVVFGLCKHITSRECCTVWRARFNHQVIEESDERTSDFNFQHSPSA